MTKIKILTFIRWYLPGYKSGGPVRTIANMVDQLNDEFEFLIVCLDRDMLDHESYPNIETNSWNKMGNSHVFYAAPEFMTFMNVLRLIRETEYDILYLNSFWSPKFTVLPLLARWLGLLPEKPVVLAPRGQFSQGALALKKWKKFFFIHLSILLGFYNNIRWQASSEYEQSDIRKTIGPQRAGDIHVAPDLPQKIESIKIADGYKLRSPGDPLRVVFLSRISPMKNLDYIFEVLALIEESLIFDIFGSIDDESYWTKCKLLLSKVPEHVQITYHGSIDHQAVAETLVRYDLFFLPTRGENFGHVICEALSVGTPVLISDRTPWQGLDEAGAGWIRPLDDRLGFVNVINKTARKESSLLLRQREKARQYVSDMVRKGHDIKANIELFKGCYISVS